MGDDLEHTSDSLGHTSHHEGRDLGDPAPSPSPDCPPRRRARALAERAAQLEAILASIADGLVVTDAHGRLLSLNPACRTLLGLDGEPRKGVTLRALQRRAGYALLDAQGHLIMEAERPVNRILRGEVLTGTKHVDLVLRTRAGRAVRVNVGGAPIRDRAGQLLGAVQVLRDVTEQRRLEQDTREALHALLAMAEALVQVQVPSHNVGRSGEPTPHEEQASGQYSVPQRLAELTCRVLAHGYVSVAAVEPETARMHPVTVVGLAPFRQARWWASWSRPRRLGEFVGPDTLAALRAGEPVVVARADLPTRWAQRQFPGHAALLVPMRLGETLVGILTVDGGVEAEAEPSPDRRALIRAIARLGALVLDRERLLRERAAALASAMALREANAQMDTFVAVAGHELKTPLTSMMLSLHLTERCIRRLARRGPDVARAVEPALEYVALAERQTERLDRLVNDLLDASRVRAGKLQIHRGPADLAAIVREAAEEQRRLAPARDLRLQLPADLRVPVTADACRLGQVVTNYLTNALKYSPANRPVAVGAAADGRQARVWVRDEGPGLPAEEHECIWDCFHRARGIEVQYGSGIGLGLGLHVCRTIVERHGGRVGVESTPGRGSTFWFTLPLDRQEADASLTQS